MLKNVYSAIENAEELQNKIKKKNEELVRFEKELHSLRNKHRSALLDIFGSEEPEFPLWSVRNQPYMNFWIIISKNFFTFSCRFLN